MTNVRNKADYVRSEATRNTAFDHHCHWPGCDKSVPPAMWGCRQHWFKLPLRLRNRIWATYRPGQEVTKTPSREYMVVAQAVQDWIAAQAMSAREGQDPKGLGGDSPASAVAESDAPNSTPPETSKEDSNAHP